MQEKLQWEYDDIKIEIGELQQNLEEKKLQYVLSHSIDNKSIVKDKKEMAIELDHSLASLESAIQKKKVEMSKVIERLTELVKK